MADLSPGTIFAGHRIDGIAGRGGMGVVYRAVDLSLDRAVALKVVAEHVATDPAFRDRFKRESRHAASLHHPNILPIYQAGEFEGALFITMHLVEGSDLRVALAGGPLEQRAVLDIVGQVADALDSAHARGLVHRDVKPANVLLEPTARGPHVYLSDFGLTKQVTSESNVTATGIFVGTLDYAAPEQFRGDPVDARTDVYALGCLAYHVLGGSVPFPRDSDMAKMYAHVHDPPPPLREHAPSLPPAVDDVVGRAMAKEPEQRFPSAGDFARALSAAVVGAGVTIAERSVATGAAAPGTGETEAATPGVGAAPPTEAAVTAPQGPPVAPVASAPIPTPIGWGRPSRAVLIGGALAIVVAVGVALALTLGGDDAPSGGSETGTERSSSNAAAEPPSLTGKEARSLLASWRKAFAAEDAKKLTALTEGASYAYLRSKLPGRPNYRKLFKRSNKRGKIGKKDPLRVRGFRMRVTRLSTTGDRGTATVEYSYVNAGNPNCPTERLNGTATFRLGDDGEPRITEIRDRPGILFKNNQQVTATYATVLRAKAGGRVIGRSRSSVAPGRCFGLELNKHADSLRHSTTVRAEFSVSAPGFAPVDIDAKYLLDAPGIG